MLELNFLVRPRAFRQSHLVRRVRNQAALRHREVARLPHLYGGIRGEAEAGTCCKHVGGCAAHLLPRRWRFGVPSGESLADLMHRFLVPKHHCLACRAVERHRLALFLQPSAHFGSHHPVSRGEGAGRERHPRERGSLRRRLHGERSLRNRLRRRSAGARRGRPQRLRRPLFHRHQLTQRRLLGRRALGRSRGLYGERRYIEGAPPAAAHRTCSLHDRGNGRRSRSAASAHLLWR